MTLIPVSNISTVVDCSSYAGGSRWIGQRSLESTLPRPSTGSPMTFRMRPRVSLPTGTEIGPPMSVAFMPRTMPSVGFIETHRTTLSPSCCATSAMTSMGPPLSLPSSSTRTAL